VAKIKNSSFIISNIENLDLTDSLNLDHGNLYFDSFKKQKFEKLSNAQKLKYLKKFLKYENGTEISDEWIELDLQAFIIGTRPKVGNLQPIIIKVYGTDYTAAILVNLDDNGNVVSGFPIFSLENSGPEFMEDTIIITRPKTKCKFENNTILTSKMVGKCKLPFEGIPTFSIVQINYITTIGEKGEIKTTAFDTLNYSKKCKLDFFQSY